MQKSPGESPGALVPQPAQICSQFFESLFHLLSAIRRLIFRLQVSVILFQPPEKAVIVAYGVPHLGEQFLDSVTFRG